VGESDVGVAIEPNPDVWPESDEAKLRFIAEVKAHVAQDKIASSIEQIFFHPSFPVDSRHNAKIYRDQLSQWASKLAKQNKAA
jgi:hypothetical protein